MNQPVDQHQPLARLQRIVSGGQTGVDRAALDLAIARGLPHGGWCPSGRRAADGPLPSRYQLRETASTGYRQRTRANVADSDGTLIIYSGTLTGGSLLTDAFTRKLGKPGFLWSLQGDAVAQQAAFYAWLTSHSIRVLNIAGPSDTSCPGIYEQAYDLLEWLWQ